MSQEDQERYPAVEVDASIPLPTAPRSAGEMLEYIQRLHYWLADNQVQVSEAVNNLAYHRTSVATNDDQQGTGTPSTVDGGTVAMPDAVDSKVTMPLIDRETGQGRIFVDIRNEVGTPQWYEIGGGRQGEILKDPNGFEPDSQTDAVTSLSVDPGTRTFTIAPVSDSFFYWHHGVRVKVTEPKSVVFPDTTGIHHFYFDEDGVLQTNTAPSIETLIRDNVYVANVYWNSFSGTPVICGDERHGLAPWQWHYWQHEFGGGAKYGSGLTLGDLITDDTGSSDTHVQFSVANGEFVDEDILHVITSKSAGFTISILAKSGFAGDWDVIAKNDAPIVLDLGVPQINTFGGGTWGQSPVTANKFYLAHIFATNDWTADGEVIAIQGENEYSNVTAAREGALTEIGDLYTNGLPVAEFIPLGTIIYEYKTGYTNTYSSRSRTTDAGDDYVPWINTVLQPGVGPSDHSALTGRDSASQHPASSVDLFTTPTGLLAGDTTVDQALTALDGLIDGMNGAGSGRNFNNNAGLMWNNAAGSASIPGFWIDTNNLARIGTNLVFDGYARLGNNKYLFGRNAADTLDIWIAGVSGSDEVTIGSGSYVTRINSGGTLYLAPAGSVVEVSGYTRHPNANGVQIKETGGTARTILTVDASNESAVGHPSLNMNLYANGTIDAQANDITTTGDITAAECDIDRRQNARTKTLIMGGGNSFAQCNVSGTPGAASITLHYEIIVQDTTNVQIESGHIEYNMTRTSGGTQVGSFTKFGTTNNCSTGTLTVNPLIFTLSAGVMVARVQPISTGLTTPTGVMNYSVTGNGARTMTWL